MKGRMEMQTFKRFGRIIEQLEQMPFCYAMYASKCNNEGGPRDGLLYEIQIHLGMVDGQDQTISREFDSFEAMVVAIDDLLPMLKTLAKTIETSND